MRTAIDSNERALVEYHVGNFRAGLRMCEQSQLRVAELLAIDPDDALDLLNDEADLFDRLGVETYPADPRPTSYPDFPDPLDIRFSISERIGWSAAGLLLVVAMLWVWNA